MSTNITEILSPDGATIYIQYDEEVSDELVAVSSPIEDIQERTEKFKKAIASTVSGYSQMILNTVKEGTGSLAPSKVTLEFGLQAGGETGIPFVTKGTAQANVKVTIEWDLS
ncbi:MAG: CU044_2847 family protein [Xenococcaceae cyanobacterium]